LLLAAVAAEANQIPLRAMAAVAAEALPGPASLGTTFTTSDRNLVAEAAAQARRELMEAVAARAAIPVVIATEVTMERSGPAVREVRVTTAVAAAAVVTTVAAAGVQVPAVTTKEPPEAAGEVVVRATLRKARGASRTEAQELRGGTAGSSFLGSSRWIKISIFFI
jgi:hypothetical protein